MARRKRLAKSRAAAAQKKAPTQPSAIVKDGHFSSDEADLSSPPPSPEIQSTERVPSPDAGEVNLPEDHPAHDTIDDQSPPGEQGTPTGDQGTVEGAQGTVEGDQDEQLSTTPTAHRTSRGELVRRTPSPTQIDTPPSKQVDRRIRDVQRDHIIDKVYLGTAVLCVAALNPIWPVSKPKGLNFQTLSSTIVDH
jgi:hypothetical protein